MAKDIDSGVEDYTSWLHDMMSEPCTIECDNCQEYVDEDTPEGVEFGGCFFCCPECFQEALLTNDILMEEWEQEEWLVDDF